MTRRELPRLPSYIAIVREPRFRFAQCSPRVQTPWLLLQEVWRDAVSLELIRLLRRAFMLPVQFQALFTCIFCMLFNFRSRYWCAIGLRVCLGLEVNSPKFTLANRRALLRVSAHARFPSPTGLSPCIAALSSALRLEPCVKSGPCNTTSLLSLRKGFGLPSSTFIRITCGISLISFPPLTKIFQFSGCAILSDRFGNPGIRGCLRLPRAFRSLPRPSSLPKPSHSLNGF